MLYLQKLLNPSWVLCYKGQPIPLHSQNYPQTTMSHHNCPMYQLAAVVNVGFLLRASLKNDIRYTRISQKFLGKYQVYSPTIFTSDPRTQQHISIRHIAVNKHSSHCLLVNKNIVFLIPQKSSTTFGVSEELPYSYCWLELFVDVVFCISFNLDIFNFS